MGVIHPEKGLQGDDTPPTVEALELGMTSLQITGGGLYKEKDCRAIKPSVCYSIAEWLQLAKAIDKTLLQHI